MRIMLFNQSDNLYEKGLASLESGYVVAPSPQMADIFRKKLAPYQTNLDVITVSKFLRDELSFLKGEEISQNYRGKSELLLLLSTLWKKLEVEEASYELFQRCFRLLTDLRSFSMSDDVLETALEHFDEKIAFGTLRMHQVLNQLDIYDEHRSYFQLSEQLRSGELPITYGPVANDEGRNIVFFGFDFLSASQVDLLKSLAIRDNVIVPVYQKVYESLSGMDWLSWLDADEAEKIQIDEARPEKEIQMRFFPKNYLAKSVKTLLERGPEAETHIVLGERNLSYEKIQQTALAPANYKASADILGDKVQWLFEEVSHEGATSTSELLEKLEEILQCGAEQQDFRAVRAVQLLNSIASDWRDLSEDNETVTPFDFKILKEAVLLDAPRVFQTSLGKKKFKLDIRGLKELDDLDRGKRKIFCVASDFSPPKGNIVQYTEGVERYLGSIGPLRRAELEFTGLKEKLADALEEGSLFLVEEGLLERDQNWKSFFESASVSSAAMGLDFQKKFSYHVPEQPKEKRPKIDYSATNLQTFLDCPRKYYFKYILKLSPKYSLEDRLDPLELGSLQHAAIEKYVSAYDAYSRQDHENLTEELLAQALKKKSVDKASVADHRLEILSNTALTIQELLRLKAQPETTVRFERPLSGSGFRGSVDCVVEGRDDVLLLDFKRGAGSVPTQTAFKAFEKIQLWFYANHWDFKGKAPVLGYVCLSDLESSTIFYSNESSREGRKGIFGAKSASLSKNFDELFERYKETEKRTIERLEKESEFGAYPLRPRICDFCDLNKLCPRSERKSERRSENARS